MEKTDLGLQILEIEITDKCNTQCKHCYLGNARRHKTMPEKLLLKTLNECEKNKVARVIITGGEALLEPKLVEKAAEFKPRKFELGLMTNGLLVNEGSISLLKKFDFVQLSFDNLPKKKAVRAIKPEKIIEKARFLQNNGIRTNFLCTLSKHNIKNLDGIMKTAESLSIPITFNRMYPVGRAKEMQGQILSKKEFQNAISKILASNAKTQKITDPLTVLCSDSKKELALKSKRIIGGCIAGIAACSISPEGRLFPCPLLRISAGSLKKNSLKKIWLNSKILGDLRNRSLFEKCKDCKYVNACGGCRASAFAAYGKINAPDPLCFK